MYIRLPIYLFFYMEHILNDLDGGKSNSRAIRRGWPWKSKLFWALKWQQVMLNPHSTSLKIPAGGRGGKVNYLHVGNVAYELYNIFIS